MADPITPAPRLRVYIAYAIVSVVWGSTYLAIRVGVMEMPPFWMAGIRFLLAGLILGGFALATGRRFPRDARSWGWSMLTGWLVLGVAVGSMFWAEQHIDSGLAALLTGTAPILMAFYGSLGKEGDRIGFGMVVGLLVGIAGVAILVDPEWAVTSGSRPLIAVGLIVVVGSQAWCGGSVLAKRKLAHVPSLVNAAIHSLTAGVFLLLVDLVLRGGGIPPASAAAWASLAYLTVFGSVVAYSAYVYLVAHMAPARAGTYSYINPVVAVLLGWLLLHEPMTLRVVAGGLIILSGLFVVRRAHLVPRSGPTPTPAPTET